MSKHVFLSWRFLRLTCLLGLLGAGAQAATTTTALTAPGPSSPLNVPVTLTAQITPNTASGTVTFYDGAAIIGVSTITQGVATLSYAPLFAGHRLLRAYYRGSGADSPSYSPIVALAVQATPAGNFGGADGFEVSGNLISPVIGDFNNDGMPDAAMVPGDDTVVVFIAQGSLDFAYSTPITGLNQPGAIVTGDFNMDGKLDLAIADTGNSQMVIALGNGDGTFQAGVVYPVGSMCQGIVVGDFDGDGIVDVATLSSGVGIGIFHNNGDGTFQSVVNTAVAGTLSSIVTGDFDRDGVADLAVANQSSNAVEVFFGGSLGLRAPASYTVGSPGGLTVADFNDDGFEDLAVIGNTAQASLILLGNANGTFQTQTSVGSLPDVGNIIASADLDGDGAMDLVVSGGDFLSILMGKGDGTFYAPYERPFGGVLGMALGSVDLSGTTGFLFSGYDGLVFFDGGPFPAVIAQGDEQTIPAGGGALTPLQVQLTDYNHNYQMPGVPVTFAAPAPGPSGYFPGAGASVTVPTAANGIATAPEFVSNSALGSYSLSAGTPDNDVSFSLTNAAPVSGSASCSYVVYPAALVFNSDGGTSTVTVTPSPAGCAWSVSSSASWIQTSVDNFTGSANVTVTAPANLSGATQNADMLVAGQYLQVFQWGTAPAVADAPPGASGAQVTDMVGFGFSSGCSSNPVDYCPANPITRAQAAVLLVRAVYGSDTFSFSTTPHFNDVDSSSFGFQWIQKLYELGVSNGCGGGNFCPTEELPRNQAAVLVIRARLGPATPFDNPSTPYFSDVPANAFGFNSIQRLRLENITSGCTPTTFCPDRSITRAELAAFIMRGLTNQFLPSGTALITEVTSNQPVRTLDPYAATTLVLTGQNTHFDMTSTIVVAGGLTTSAFTVFSPTYATVTVQGDGNTALDIPESIIITTGSEEAVIPNPIVFENNCD